MNSYNYIDNLSYQEADKFVKDKDYREWKIDNAKCCLFKNILVDKKHNVENWDAAFRFRLQVIDNMNIVGKVEEIPIEHVVLKLPTQEDVLVEAYDSVTQKLKFKDRIKILLKGRL